MSTVAIAPWLLAAVEPHPALMGAPPVPRQFHDVEIGMLPAKHKALRGCVERYGSKFWEAATAGVGPLFLGAPATYKSFSAAVLMKGIHQRACIRTAWCDVPIGLNQLERRRFTPETDELIDHWKTVPWLVIDDFGMARPDSWQHGVLVEVGMARFDARRPTCWTANIEAGHNPSPDDVGTALKRAVGVQLARRLLERSQDYRVYVR